MMPANVVKSKSDEKYWKKAKETANARAKDDSSFKKDSDAYWAFVNSQFQKFKSGELKSERTMKRRKIQEGIPDPYDWLDEVWSDIQDMLDEYVEMDDYALHVGTSSDSLAFDGTQIVVITPVVYEDDNENEFSRSSFDEHFAVTGDVTDDEIKITVQLVNAGMMGPDEYTYPVDFNSRPDAYDAAREIADQINSDIEGYFSGLGPDDFAESTMKRRTPIHEQAVTADALYKWFVNNAGAPAELANQFKIPFDLARALHRIGHSTLPDDPAKFRSQATDAINNYKRIGSSQQESTADQMIQQVLKGAKVERVVEAARK